VGFVDGVVVEAEIGLVAGNGLHRVVEREEEAEKIHHLLWERCGEERRT